MAKTTTRDLHERAMRATDRALGARRDADVVGEFRLIVRALRLELRAAGHAAVCGASVQTLSVLTDSAHALNRRMVELINGPGERGEREEPHA